jgi:regulator of protease activity HflC (stomatin/prohibitin superfamily)
MLALNILLYPMAVTGFIMSAVALENRTLPQGGGLLFLFSCVVLLVINGLVSAGFIVLQPNVAAVLTLFGKYSGAVKENGFFWVNPFMVKRKVSLRSHNLNGERLKVNDKAGNPIEIAAVIVWKVQDTFAACFEVESYIDYVKVQSESALRHLASTYPYDSWEEGDDHAISLRGNIDQVCEALEEELRERLKKAGVKVEEARLSHLAYAPEIAEAMLRRQQASAIIAARQKIVEGAVGMVQMALDKLSTQNIVHLDDERKAAMVSNLLVVLCGEKEAHPVINAGTLY